MFKSLVIGFFVIARTLLIASDPALMREEALEKEIASLDLQYEGTYKMPFSHSTLYVPERCVAIFGSEARKFIDLMEIFFDFPSGISADNTLEAIVSNFTDPTKGVVLFFYYDEGNNSLSHWEACDHKEILSIFNKKTEQENIRRRKKGCGEIHNIGWIQKPKIDKRTNTVFFAIEVEDVGERHFNAFALKLGRQGFEMVMWVGPISEYKSSGGELDIILAGFNFDPGHRLPNLESKGAATNKIDINSFPVAREKSHLIVPKDTEKRSTPQVNQSSRNSDAISMWPIFLVLFAGYLFWLFGKKSSNSEDPFRYVWDLSILEEKFLQLQGDEHQLIERYYKQARNRIEVHAKYESCFARNFFSEVEDEMIRMSSPEVLKMKTLEYAKRLANVYGYHEEETVKKSFFCPGWNDLWELYENNKERILLKKPYYRQWQDWSESYGGASNKGSDDTHYKKAGDYYSEYQRSQYSNPSSKGAGTKNQDIFKDIWDLKELKRKYYKLAKINHPDRGGSDQAMKLLNQYYQQALLRILDRESDSEKFYRNA